MTLNQKVEIYKKLVAGLSKGVKLAALLDRLGEIEKRKQVEKKNDELGKRAAALRQEIQKSWNARAGAILEALRASSSKLQDQVREIERTRQTGNRFVTAIGQLDELIDIARNVASAIA